MGRSRREEDSQLGPNLRAVREQQKLSLRDIEKTSGLSNGYLSQLERGEVGHPSPTVLRKLAEGYEIELLILLRWAGYLDSEELDLSPNQAVALSTIGDPSTEELRAFQGIFELLRGNRTVASSPVGDDSLPLDEVAQREIAGYARALLLEADALGQRPTPLPDLQAAAELVRIGEVQITPTDKAELSRRLGRWVDLNWRKLRGALDFRSRSIWIKPELHPKQERFTISHEIGHAILPAHQEFFAYVDYAKSLTPDFRHMLEREANYAGAQLLFQCGEATEEADSSVLDLSAICALADLFGASIVATAREIAETSQRDVAVAIAYQPRTAMGPTHLFTSASFEQRYRWRAGRAPLSAARQSLVTASTSVHQAEWTCADARERPTKLSVETLHTSYAAIALFVRESSIRRTGRRLLSAS